MPSQPVSTHKFLVRYKLRTDSDQTEPQSAEIFAMSETLLRRSFARSYPEAVIVSVNML